MGELIHHVGYRIGMAMLLSAVAAGCRRADPASVERPQIVIPDPHRELKAVAASPDPLQLVYVIENRQSVPLRLLERRLSCTCLGSRISRDLVPPWGSAEVTIELALNEPGRKQASVTLVTDAALPHPVISVDWDVVAPIACTEAMIDFGLLLPGTRTERSINLTKRLPKYRIISVESPAPPLVVSAWSQDDESGTVRLAVEAPETIGAGHGTLTVRAENTWPESFTVPVRWRVRNEIEAVPPRLYLGATKGASLQGRFALSDYRGRAIEIERIECLSGGPVTANLFPGTTGVSVVEVSAAPSTESGAVTNDLRVHVQAPTACAVDVPISYVVQAMTPLGEQP
jgi:hypothetical protein